MPLYEIYIKFYEFVIVFNEVKIMSFELDIWVLYFFSFFGCEIVNLIIFI